MLDAEALLLVDDDKAQIVELLHRWTAAGACPQRYPLCRLLNRAASLLLLRRAVAGQQPDADGEGLHPGQRRVKVLPRQNCGGGKDGAPLAAHHALERRPQRNLGFADADIAAEQAVHRPRLLHIVLDVRRAGQLVGRFLVGEALFKNRPARCASEGKA